MPILSCLYKHFVPHNISHPLALCIIVSSYFWYSLHILETPWFHIFSFVTLISRTCSCSAQIRDSVSNCSCAEWNHLCLPSVLTDVSLDCCRKHCPCIFMLYNPFLWYLLISSGVPHVITTQDHDIVHVLIINQLPSIYEPMGLQTSPHTVINSWTPVRECLPLQISHNLYLIKTSKFGEHQSSHGKNYPSPVPSVSSYQVLIVQLVSKVLHQNYNKVMEWCIHWCEWWYYWQWQIIFLSPAV